MATQSPRVGEIKGRASRAPVVQPRSKQSAPFVPGAAEATVVAGLIPKVLARSKIRLKVDRGSDGATVVADYPDPAAGLVLLMSELGTVDADFVDAVVLQLAKLSGTGSDPGQKSLNHGLAMLKGIRPSDELESMLALQMVAVHNMAMKHARMLNEVETIPAFDIQERSVNKLMRTFTMQMEALKRHRTGGKQKVEVRHIHVSRGGQAIVADVTYGGRPTHNTGGQSLESQISFSVGPTMQGYFEAYRQALPGPRGDRLEGLPVSRGRGGSSEG